MNVGDQFDKSEVRITHCIVHTLHQIIVLHGNYICRSQIKQVWKEAPLDGGKLDYLKFVAIIKRGKDDE